MKNTSYLIALSCLLASSFSLAAPFQLEGVKPLNATRNVIKPPQVTNRLNLKPDLIISSLGFNNEFCTQRCSNQWTNELGVTRLNDSSCAFQVIVKNQGNAASNPGNVSLTYPSLGGTVRLSGRLPRLRAGESKSLLVPFNNSRMRYLYWEYTGQLQGKVDSANSSRESNEGNNSKSVSIQSFN